MGGVWVCGCGEQGYVIDARRLARQQFRLGRNSFHAWRSARQCQGMLPRTALRPSALFFSLINFLPRTVPRQQGGHYEHMHPTRDALTLPHRWHGASKRELRRYTP